MWGAGGRAKLSIDYRFVSPVQSLVSEEGYLTIE